MLFDAIYIDDEGTYCHRYINAPSTAEAKEILQTTMTAEGRTYCLDIMIDTEAPLPTNT